MADHEENPIPWEQTKASSEFHHAVDPELRDLLKQWRVPECTSNLDQRVLAAYRSQVEGVRLWRAMLYRSVSIPVPVAAAVLLGMVFLITRGLRNPEVVRVEVPSAPHVVRVEVPVIREKVVTRRVYVKALSKDAQEKALNRPWSPDFAPPDPKVLEDPKIAARLVGFDPVEKIQLKVISWKGGR